MDGDRPYLLLTPGPLSTTPGVRRAMGTDLSTWDRDYLDIVQRVRRHLVELAVEHMANLVLLVVVEVEALLELHMLVVVMVVHHLDQEVEQ